MKCGKIKVITGPMCSGKSDEVIRIINKLKISNKRYIIFKPSNDTRDKDKVISRSGYTHNQFVYMTDGIERSKEIVNKESINVIDGCIDTVIIDEAHFYNNDILDFVRELSYRGINVVISGLDMSHKGDPFVSMALCMGVADEVQKLTAICCDTQEDTATHTYMKIYDDSDTVSGGDDIYEPLCKTSWYLKTKGNNKWNLQ